MPAWTPKHILIAVAAEYEAEARRCEASIPNLLSWLLLQLRVLTHESSAHSLFYRLRRKASPERVGMFTIQTQEIDMLYRQIVEVENHSLEPDGSRRVYFLMTPKECSTALEAVAWTFDMRPDEYAQMAASS